MFYAQSLLRFYWSAREESLEVCADRIDVMLKEFAKIDPRLKNFDPFAEHEKKSSAKSAVTASTRKRLPRNQRFLQALLDNRSRSDFTGELLPGSGSGIYLIGTDPEFPAQISIRCGLNSPYISNIVVVYLPVTQDTGTCVVPRDSLLELSTTIIRLWNPDRGAFLYSTIQDSLPDSFESYDVGPITYLSNGIELEPKLPESVKTVILDQGRLFYIDRDPLLPKDPAHRRMVIGLHKRFRPPPPPKPRRSRKP
ncbi:MAG: Imm52 family immunity protein [Fimbriiglobus sp.]